MTASTDIRRPLSQRVHSDWRYRLLQNFFTDKINNFEVSPHHCSTQNLIYSPTIGCAKCLLTWQIARKYLHGLATQASSRRENIVCRLNKSLYGLKKASRTWFSTFSHVIKSAEFRQSNADYSLFTRHDNSSFIVLLIYVEDILLT